MGTRRSHCYIAVLIFLNGCASIAPGKESIKTPTWDQIYRQAPQVIDFNSPLDYSAWRQNAEELRNKVRISSRRPLSPNTQALYQAFAKNLAEMKLRHAVLSTRMKVAIPPHSQVKLSFHWFCLNHTRHIADEHEYVYWKKGDPKIPYYSELLFYADTHRDNLAVIQRLIWNLQEKVPFYSYPSDYQTILRDVDPAAPTKLAFSDLKHSLLEQAKQMAMDSSVGQGVQQAASPYRDYTKEIKNLLNSHSPSPIPHVGEPQVIDADPLFATSLYSGFEMVTTFYNVADTPFLLDLSKFYLDPARSDVQRQALLPMTLPDEESSLYDVMVRIEQEIKPYVTPIRQEGPNPTVDDIPTSIPGGPYITPETPEPHSTPGDRIPSQEPPLQHTSGDSTNSGTNKNPVIVTKDGQEIQIPDNYEPQPAENGNGTVYRPKGSTGNANSIRVMGPTDRYPNGYLRIYNSYGQPIDLKTDKPGSQADTHIPLKGKS